MSYVIFSIIISSLFFNQLQAEDLVYNYALKSNGEVVYCGISEEPVSRCVEHQDAGKFRFDVMVVYGGPYNKAYAYEKETRCIERHPIPNAYQLYPRDTRYVQDLEAEDWEYPDHIPVVFTAKTKQKMKRKRQNLYFAHYKRARNRFME